MMRPGTASHLNPLSSRRAPVAAVDGLHLRVAMSGGCPGARRKALEAWRCNHLIRKRPPHKAIWLGTVEATDERDAIEKVAKGA